MGNLKSRRISAYEKGGRDRGSCDCGHGCDSRGKPKIAWVDGQILRTTFKIV